jgi:hypothetical protein
MGEPGREKGATMATIETTAGDVMVATAGAHEEDSHVSVRVTVALGQRYVCGDVSVTRDGEAMGQSRDAWVSAGILALLDAEVPEREHRAVLDGIEAEAGRRARVEAGT